MAEQAGHQPVRLAQARGEAAIGLDLGGGRGHRHRGFTVLGLRLQPVGRSVSRRLIEVARATSAAARGATGAAAAVVGVVFAVRLTAK